MSLWKKLVAGISSATARDVILDSATHALIIADKNEHMEHTGERFIYYDVQQNLASGGVMMVAMHTPNTTKWVHLDFAISANRKTHFEFVQNPTIHATGSDENGLNYNRNHSTGSNMIIYSGVSATDVGTVVWLYEQNVGATGLGGGGVGGGDDFNHFILKQDATYLLKAEAQDADDTINMHLTWCECVDKN